MPTRAKIKKMQHFDVFRLLYVFRNRLADRLNKSRRIIYFFENDKH